MQCWLAFMFLLCFTSHLIVKADCGVRSAYADQLIGDKRITGGQESMKGAWPWMAALYVDGPPVFFKCGAALLSERWVITAGHCGLISNGLTFAGAHTMPNRIRVRLGEHNINEATGDEQEIIANKVIFHPKWDILTKSTSQGPKTVSTYDLMLVELKNPAKITANVSPICLTTQQFPPGKMCHIAGWGNEKVNGPVHSILHEAAIPVVTQQECNKPESYCGSIADDLLCAGFQQGGKDSCEGDSGGPLMCKGADQKWYIAGVASFGHTECGIPHKYGIYAKIASAMEWITNNTGISVSSLPVSNTYQYTKSYDPYNYNNYDNMWDPFG